MLFASRKIELLPSGLIRLDNWISLTLDPRAAAAVAALRPSLEALVIRCAAEPENIADPGHQEDRTIQAGWPCSYFIFQINWKLRENILNIARYLEMRFVNSCILFIFLRCCLRSVCIIREIETFAKFC